MLSFFTITLYVLSGIITVWSLVETIRNRAANKYLLAAVGLLLALLIVQLIVAVVLWSTQHDTDPLLFFGYLLTAILLVPIAGFWAYAELSRWGPGVLIAAGLTVIIMVERMDQIWV